MGKWCDDLIINIRIIISVLIYKSCLFIIKYKKKPDAYVLFYLWDNTSPSDSSLKYCLLFSARFTHDPLLLSLSRALRIFFTTGCVIWVFHFPCHSSLFTSHTCRLKEFHRHERQNSVAFAKKDYYDFDIVNFIFCYIRSPPSN